MPRPDRQFDWHAVPLDDRANSQGSLERTRTLLRVLVAAVVVIVLRGVQLEWRDGEAYRREIAAPLVSRRPLPTARGRILDRHGAVLAADQATNVLAVHYRWLEEPPNPAWLKSTTRKRLSKRERRDAARVATAISEVLAERAELHRRLAELSGLQRDPWLARCAGVQARVEAVAERVAKQHAERAALAIDAAEPTGDVIERLGRWLHDLVPVGDEAAAPESIAEAEQYHVLADLSDQQAQHVRGNPTLFPGTKAVALERRGYPQRSVAANLLGYVGTPAAPAIATSLILTNERPRPRHVVGLLGAEAAWESSLRGTWGEAEEERDQRGMLRTTRTLYEPRPGADVRLTIDLPLQAVAEALLDRAGAGQAASASRSTLAVSRETAGGAILVLDLADGSLLAAASAPRFDPNVFTALPLDARQAVLTDPGQPLFDRALRMAIAPGSVFKIATALAILESGTAKADETFDCQGYLHDPESFRCQIYRRSGAGHGPLDMSGALAQSCNTYFFHYSRSVGVRTLVDWAQRCGFGRLAGIELAGEASGELPRLDAAGSRHESLWRTSDTQLLAVGQGSLTATPLQVAQLLAAVATGGRMVRPKLNKATADLAASESAMDVPAREESWNAIRRGLVAAVQDPGGTAFAAFEDCTVSVAGKTGTAETGASRPDHAWFAGYAPSDQPRYVVVVAVAHGGEGGRVAAPIARELIDRMAEMGYFAKFSGS